MTSVDSVVMLHPISLADSVLDLDLSVLSVEVEVVETLTNADFVNQDPMIPLEAKLVLPIAKKENLFVRDPVRHNVEDFEPLKYTYIIQSAATARPPAISSLDGLGGRRGRPQTASYVPDLQ